MELIFATGNKNKLSEAQAIIKNHRILSLKDINCFDDIPETGNTIYDNAVEKALYLWKKYQKNCFSDDTALQAGGHRFESVYLHHVGASYVSLAPGQGRELAHSAAPPLKIKARGFDFVRENL